MFCVSIYHTLVHGHLISLCFKIQLHTFHSCLLNLKCLLICSITFIGLSALCCMAFTYVWCHSYIAHIGFICASFFCIHHMGLGTDSCMGQDVRFLRLCAETHICEVFAALSMTLLYVFSNLSLGTKFKG